MDVNVSLGCRMFFYTHTGEVISFLKLQFPHLCIYNVTGDQKCISVTHCMVTTSCMEKRVIVAKSSHISFRCYRLLTVSVSCNRTRCVFLVTLQLISTINLILTNSACHRCSNGKISSKTSL